MLTILIVTNVLTLGGLIYSLFSNARSGIKDHNALKSEGEPISMDAMLAKTLVLNYKTNHFSIVNDCKELSGLRNPDSITDSRAVWFNLDIMKQFIYQIETTTAKNFGNNKKSLGIRIYYGEYPAPDSDLWGSKSLPKGAPLHLERYAGMHTLIMVPTYYDHEHKINIDFDPKYVNNNGPMSMSDVYKSFPKQMETKMAIIETAVTTTTDSSTVTILNHGELVPPPYSATGSSGASGANFIDAADQ